MAKNKNASKIIEDGSAAVKRVSASNSLGSVEPSQTETMPSPEDMHVLIDHIIRAGAESIAVDVGGTLQHRTKIVQALVVSVTKLREFIDAMINQYLEDNSRAIVLSQKGNYSEANDLIQKCAGIELVLMAAGAFMPTLKLVDIPDLYERRRQVQDAYSMTSSEVTASGEAAEAKGLLHRVMNESKLHPDLDKAVMEFLHPLQTVDPDEGLEDPEDIP